MGTIHEYGYRCWFAGLIAGSLIMAAGIVPFILMALRSAEGMDLDAEIFGKEAQHGESESP